MAKIRIAALSILNKMFYTSPEFSMGQGKETKTFSRCLSIGYQVQSYSEDTGQLRHRQRRSWATKGGYKSQRGKI